MALPYSRSHIERLGMRLVAEPEPADGDIEELHRLLEAYDDILTATLTRVRGAIDVTGMHRTRSCANWSSCSPTRPARQRSSIDGRSRHTALRHAMQARFRAEAEYRGQRNVEVVALSAASEDDLKRTHGRYFLGLDELASRIG